MTEIELAGDKVKLSLSVDDEGRVAFAGLHLVGAADACNLCRPYPEYTAPVVEVQLAGDDTMRHYTCHGATQAGRELRYVSHELEGGHLTLSLRSARLAVKQNFKLAGGGMIESWAEVTNVSSAVQTLEYISSLALPHIDACDYAPWDRYLWVNVPVNSWCAEAQWQRYSLPQLDYTMLQRHSIQSVTDQTDFRIMSAIACNAASLVTPEQAAIWAYPLKSATPEEVVTNMINALLLRVHQSGAIEELDAARLSLVTEALQCYKALRADIKDALPFWPLGFATIGDPYLSFGLKTDQKLYLAVFRGEAASDVISLPLPRPVESAQVLYPHHAAEPYSLSADGTVLNVSLPQNFMSRLFVLS